MSELPEATRPIPCPCCDNCIHERDNVCLLFNFEVSPKYCCGGYEFYLKPTEVEEKEEEGK